MHPNTKLSSLSSAMRISTCIIRIQLFSELGGFSFSAETGSPRPQLLRFQLIIQFDYHAFTCTVAEWRCSTPCCPLSTRCAHCSHIAFAVCRYSRCKYRAWQQILLQFLLSLRFPFFQRRGRDASTYTSKVCNKQRTRHLP